MSDTERIELVLTAQDNISKSLDAINSKIDTLKTKAAGAEESASALTSSLGKYATAAVAGMVFKYVVDQAAESEKAINSLKSAVEISGGSWNVLGKEMQDYATKLQNTTTYSDEQVMDVMQRLVTVTGSAETGWKDAGLALDMASTGMISAEGAARAIAMAEEGNVTALGKLIPELKGANSALISHMTAAERSAYAMQLLRTNFAGRAAAEVGTYSGQMKQLQNNVGELAETVGKQMLPSFTETLKVLNDVATTLNSPLGQYLAANNVLWKAFYKVVGQVSEKLGKVMAPAIGAVGEFFGKAAHNAQDFFAPALKVVGDRWSDLNKYVDKGTEAVNKNANAANANVKTEADDLKKRLEARIAHDKEVKKIVDDFATKYNAAIQKETYSTIDGISKQKAAYEKAGVDKTQLRTWYALMVDQFNKGEAEKNLAKLKTMAGQDLAYYLALIQQNRDASAQGSLAWTEYQAEAVKVQAEILTKNWEMVQGMASNFSFNLIDKFRKGGELGDSFQSAFQTLVDDVIVTWERMIADLIAKWIASALFQGMTVNVSGGGGGGGGGGGNDLLFNIGNNVSNAIKKVPGLGQVVEGIGAITDNIKIDLSHGNLGFIKWAEGGVITRPTFGMAGESGPEAIIPLDKLDSLNGGRQIHFHEGALQIFGIDFTNEAHKRHVAKSIMKYIDAYSGERIPDGSLRRV